MADNGMSMSTDSMMPEETCGDFKIRTTGGFVVVTGYTSPKGKDILIPSKCRGMSVTCIGNVALCGMGLTGVDIPQGIEGIGVRAFADNNLTKITIPNTVTEINDGAFASNHIAEITIGNNVKIAPDAFDPRFYQVYLVSRKGGTYTRVNGQWE